MTRRSRFADRRPRAGRILRFDRSPEAPKITTSCPEPPGPEAGLVSGTLLTVFMGTKPQTSRLLPLGLHVRVAIARGRRDRDETGALVDGQADFAPASCTLRHSLR